jgi:hypothetical protein
VALQFGGTAAISQGTTRHVAGQIQPVAVQDFLFMFLKCFIVVLTKTAVKP